MSRALAQYLSLETAALGIAEFILCLLVVLAACAGANACGWTPWNGNPGLGGGPLAVSLALTLAASIALMGLYRPGTCLQRHRLVARFIAAGLAAFPAALLAIESLSGPLDGRAALWLATLILGALACIMLVRFAVATMARRNPLTRRILVVGSGARATRLADLLRGRFATRFEPVHAPAGMVPEEAARQNIWAVVIATDSLEDGQVRGWLDRKLRGGRIFRDTSFIENQLGRIDLQGIDANWLLGADGFLVGRPSAAVKRAADIAISMLLLFTTLPLMVITALLIRLDSKGPILYRQQRIGLHGQVFTLLKFRSMKVDAETGGKPRWAELRDPRITRVGAFIRSTRIDELPQLINVLRGEMSMIGPRPERPHFVEQLTEVIPFYAQRAYVKPGLTGWAQVNYPYGASVEDAQEKLAYDLYYVKNSGIVLDLLILLSTVRVILFREGAR